MRWLVLMVLLAAASVKAQNGVSGSLSLTHHHHFQGFRQNDRPASAHGSLQYEADGVSAGVWVGEFGLPDGAGNSAEIDYFVGFSTPLGFRHRIETLVWHYTYLNDDIDHYDWSQWLGRYHYDGWLSLTVGAADNLLQAKRTAWLLEALVRQPLASNASASLAVGRNRFDDHFIDSFNFATAKLIYRTGDWIVAADYTMTTGDQGYTDRWTHDGISLSLTYSID